MRYECITILLTMPIVFFLSGTGWRDPEPAVTMYLWVDCLVYRTTSGVKKEVKGSPLIFVSYRWLCMTGSYNVPLLTNRNSYMYCSYLGSHVLFCYAFLAKVRSLSAAVHALVDFLLLNYGAQWTMTVAIVLYAMIRTWF